MNLDLLDRWRKQIELSQTIYFFIRPHETGMMTSLCNSQTHFCGDQETLQTKRLQLLKIVLMERSIQKGRIFHALNLNNCHFEFSP